MDQIDEILNQLKNVAPPTDLNDKILKTVRRDNQKRRAAAGFLYSALVTALLVAVISIRLLASDVSASPLAELLRLALTDSRDVASSLGLWVMAVIESLPIGSLTLALGAIWAAVLLINRIVAMASRNQHGMLGNLGNQRPLKGA